MKKQMENIINYGKVIGIYLSIILTVALACSSFYLCIKSLTGICYSDDHIDDRYGSLDTNTKQVIEEKVIKLMKNKRVNVYFSYVYKDMNETYKNKLYSGKKYIFICYNDEDNSFKVLSDIKAVEKMKLNHNIENGDLKTAFEDAVNSIEKKIDKQSRKLFYKTEDTKGIVAISSLIATILFILVFFAIICSDNISRILRDSKEEIRENAAKKIDEKLNLNNEQQEETEETTDEEYNEDDTDTDSNTDENDQTD